jgi:hypothetical protein
MPPDAMAVDDPDGPFTSGVHAASPALDPLQRFHCLAHLRNNFALFACRFAHLFGGGTQLFRGPAGVLRGDAQRFGRVSAPLGMLAALLFLAPAALGALA